jgi:hypothetical protein
MTFYELTCPKWESNLGTEVGLIYLRFVTFENNYVFIAKLKLPTSNTHTHTHTQIHKHFFLKVLFVDRTNYCHLLSHITNYKRLLLWKQICSYKSYHIIYDNLWFLLLAGPFKVQYIIENI